MFDLEDAIRHAEEVAESKEKQVKNGDWEKDSLTERNCIKSAEEHHQLSEWLKELKLYREMIPSASEVFIAEIRSDKE